MNCAYLLGTLNFAMNKWTISDIDAFVGAQNGHLLSVFSYGLPLGQSERESSLETLPRRTLVLLDQDPTWWSHFTLLPPYSK